MKTFIRCLVIIISLILLDNKQTEGAPSVLQTYLVHVPVVNKPVAFLSSKLWHEGLLTAASSLLSRTGTVNGSTVSIPKIKDRLLYSYHTAFQGFAARLTEEEAAALNKLPEVSAMHLDKIRQLHTTYTPAYMDLFTTDGPGVISYNADSLFAAANGGSDVIIGLLDTGIWPESPSFSDDTGYTEIPDRWKGTCDDFVCNRKLIGARYFDLGLQAALETKHLTFEEIREYTSPRDRVGHGTHTASTVAGSAVANASLFGVYAPGTASGMAPAARIAMYKVCWHTMGCSDADILQGFDQAILDHVDIISISIGLENGETFYNMSVSGSASFAAAEAGITTIASAGNDGWNLSLKTVANVAPWLVTVAASTIDRDFPATVTLGNNMATYEGTSISSGDFSLVETSNPLVYAEYCSNASSLAASGVPVQGSVVLCIYGDGVGSVEKGLAVQQSGGIGMILYGGTEDIWSGSLPVFTLPAMQVGNIVGNEILNYIRSVTEPTVVLGIGKTRIGTTVAIPAPSIASFSSRGPNKVTWELLKPDITAPGVSILAAFTGGNSPSESDEDDRRVNFTIMSGTSMACPHVAGVIVLLKATHPDWSPAMLRSAIMTTATTINNQGGNILRMNTGDVASSIDMGAGQINPNAALDPGLVYDATPQDYVDFLCSIGGYNISFFSKTLTCNPYSSIVRPGDLNYPSFSVRYLLRDLTNSFTFNRTLTNVGPANSVYTVSVSEPDGVVVSVSPSSLTFGAVGEKKDYSVTFTGDPSVFSNINTTAGYTYLYADGSLTWSDRSGHNVRSPILFTWALHT